MFFIFRRDLYAAVFVGLLLELPAALTFFEPCMETFGFLLISVSTFVLCCEMCRSEDYGYVAGLANLARKYSTGFANVTLLYLVPLFALLHAYCTVVSIVGMFRGKEFTVGAWKWISEAPSLASAETAMAS